MSNKKDAVREFATCLYSGYEVDSRGPLGCIMNAIRKLDPKAARQIGQLGTDGFYLKRYGDEDA